ncbi:hypothetical protein Dimus_035105 [Dionaea muscipula]
MADVVQLRLERMVPELEDLEERGIFTRQEIAEIVKRRRKFEYRIQRPSPLKQDYLAYIEYEKQLDALRKLRKKAISRELKADGVEKKRRGRRRSVSDFAGVMRIVRIYSMATIRFKGDIELWFQFLEFCKERKHGRMKKALVEAIRFHPKVPDLWIYAAAWEFDHNLNVEAARAIMQSGLRACPSSEDLWVEYLRMELTYLNKLKTRKVILGEDVGSLIREGNGADEQWKDENKDLFMALEEQKGDKGLDEENGESREKVDLFREQGFGILRAVYRSAVENLPASFSLRKRFFEILEATDLAHSEEMREEILADMKQEFSKDPEYWDWLAKLEINDPGLVLDIGVENVRFQVDKAIQVYEEALKILAAASVVDLYIRFLMHVVEKGDESGILSTSDHTSKYITHLIGVFERAAAMGCLTGNLARQHISLFLQMGRFDEARQLAEKYCEGAFSNAVQLWDLRVSIEMKCMTRTPQSKTDLSSIFELLRKVLTNAAVSDAENLWLMALKFFANEKRYFEKLVELSILSLVRDGGSEDGFSLSSVIVDMVLEKDGINKARDLYKRFASLPHPGFALYKHCIELEKNLAAAGDKEGLKHARKLFESALSTYKEDIGLWQDYFSMETKMGTSETANGVYWRAKKILGGKVALILPSKA